MIPAWSLPRKRKIEAIVTNQRKRNQPETPTATPLNRKSLLVQSKIQPQNNRNLFPSTITRLTHKQKTTTTVHSHVGGFSFFYSKHIQSNQTKYSQRDGDLFFYSKHIRVELNQSNQTNKLNGRDHVEVYFFYSAPARDIHTTNYYLSHPERASGI